MTAPTTTRQPASRGKPDQICADAVDLAREAVTEDVAGDHIEAVAEGERVVTHYFECTMPAYRGWRWAVTVARIPRGKQVTVCETVLIPGPDALVTPDWVPWEDRVAPGDLGVGDLMPTAPDDERLAPGYLLSEDPAVEDVVWELGLGRVRVLSRVGRLDTAERWYESDNGPGAPISTSAPAQNRCVTCGFYLPLAGSMRALFGACANMYAPDDGRVVSADHGCGAHSETLVEVTVEVDEAPTVYDDGMVDRVDPEPAAADRTSTGTPADSTLADTPDGHPQTAVAAELVEPADPAQATHAPEALTAEPETPGALLAEPAGATAPAGTTDAEPASATTVEPAGQIHAPEGGASEPSGPVAADAWTGEPAWAADAEADAAVEAREPGRDSRFVEPEQDVTPTETPEPESAPDRTREPDPAADADTGEASEPEAVDAWTGGPAREAGAGDANLRQASDSETVDSRTVGAPSETGPVDANLSEASERETADGPGHEVGVAEASVSEAPEPETRNAWSAKSHYEPGVADANTSELSEADLATVDTTELPEGFVLDEMTDPEAFPAPAPTRTTDSPPPDGQPETNSTDHPSDAAGEAGTPNQATGWAARPRRDQA